MKRRGGIMLLLALAGAPAAFALTVATYNVENYNVADRMVDGVFRQAYPKPESEKAGVRRAICEMAPDILALQEMGPLPFLQELQRDLAREGCMMPHAVVLEAADAERHVALLAKMPPREIRRHGLMPIKLLGDAGVVKRGVLEATFSTGAGDLTVFVVHLKSRLTERNDDPEGARQRRLEAEAVRDLVLARFPHPERSRFLICGDFNDTRGSPPVRALLRRGDAVVGQLLPALDSHGESWTHYYRREDTYSRIDYLLVSPALQPLVVDQQARVHDGPGVEAGSDHRPLVAVVQASPGG